ncbi:restriction endonuclease [Zhihengliuella sp.]|uniref:restriction endonuclease n=1 Tax=Zhihengliuella sp. TaxID=1954483 RepID=UPI00281138B4|nr:restriction endonuclease [Zhihengliuella sp.]
MTEPLTGDGIPKWHEFMHPVLEVMSDGEAKERRTLLDEVLTSVGITASQRAITLSMGDSKAENRVGWAMSELFTAGLLRRPARAIYEITPDGQAWLAENMGPLTTGHLRHIPQWIERKEGVQQGSLGSDAGSTRRADDLEDPDPLEQIQTGIDRLHTEVGEQLLVRLRDSHPDFFEEAVVKLLLGMGYGGAEQRGMRVGGSGDGGVDGLIDQDPLGLDRLYVQAKRYGSGNTVGREQIQAFIGALHGLGAAKGVFITTSAFTKQARDYAAAIPTRIILIDGQRLISLMIKYRVGVQAARTYQVVGIDEDFFE